VSLVEKRGYLVHAIMTQNPSTQHGFSPAYVRYALSLIFLVAVMNVCDRTILSVLVPEIRTALGLSDRDLGILMGPAFAVVHIVAGLPIARLADRSSRRTIIAVGLFAWSLLTMAQGLANNFSQLLVARMGVGIGEATGSPPSHSLLADYASPEKRARALSVLQIGALCGTGLGVVLGGWVNEVWGWRAAFIAVGVPGIVLSLLVFTTLREPPRGISDGLANAPEKHESAWTAASYLLRTPSYAWMLVGVCAAGVVSIGRSAWEPTFLREVYGMGSADAGLTYFLIGPLPSAIGTLAGAFVVDKLARRDARWYLWVPALGSAITVPLSLAFILWPETDRVGVVPVAFFFSVLMSIASSGSMPAILAMGQSLAPPRMRAFSAALWSMLFTFVGMGLGPLIVGEMIERMRPDYAEQAVRYALAVASLVPVIATVFFAAAARTVAVDIERAKVA
jgi:MFS family permease